MVSDTVSYSKLHNYILIVREPKKYRFCSQYACYGFVEVTDDSVIACKVCGTFICLKCESMVEEDYRHLHHCYVGNPDVPMPCVYEKCTQCYGFTMRPIESEVIKC